MWARKEIILNEKRRGCHLITNELEKQIPELRDFEVGLCNLFIQHTSASLTINENYDKDVRKDMEDIMSTIVPESRSYRHTMEGLDDMPAHVKSSLFGCSLTIPIHKGKLDLGTWQGIYLNEHRDHGGRRKVICTLNGAGRK
eukprot:TRINITY_DN775842_c0_g1_i1.p1 TRINITY_DN775842_c0_g1~~TRINITY_DN775842_c0_g1_i1.p1  ORF type:complete len:142 (+),score=30.92 TRINITY_DN775842_c0_g1_i1:52-477(+)